MNLFNLFGNLHKRVQALEGVMPRLEAVEVNQAQIAEALRSKGNVDAELREQINVVAHDTAALMGAVDKVVSLVGEPTEEPITGRPVDVEPLARPLTKDDYAPVSDPFAGDNAPAEEPTPEPAE